jgi:hypothetical protein
VYVPLSKLVFTKSFRRLADATLTASALIIGIGFLGGSGGPAMLLADVLLSMFLLSSGLAARVGAITILVSSVPLYSLDLLGRGLHFEHALALIVIAGRLYRIASDIRAVTASAGRVNQEIVSLSAQVAILAGLMLLGGAVALYAAESSNPNSPIKSIGDALWASIATTTTVGYGDVVPITPLGRLVAASLMVYGVALITFLITNIATLIVHIAELEKGMEGLSPIEREKFLLIDQLNRDLERMSDEEFKEVVKKLNVIRVLASAGEGDLLFATPKKDEHLAESLA